MTGVNLRAAAAAALIALSFAAPTTAVAAKASAPTYYGVLSPLAMEGGQSIDLTFTYAAKAGSTCVFNLAGRIVNASGLITEFEGEIRSFVFHNITWIAKADEPIVVMFTLLPDRIECSRDDLANPLLVSSANLFDASGALIEFVPLAIVLGNIGDVLE